MLMYAKILMTIVKNVYHLIRCTAKIVMVTTLHLIKNVSFSKKFTFELLQNSMEKSNFKVALMKVNIAGFLLHSVLSLDRRIIDNGIDPVAVSEFNSQMLGSKKYDMSKSQVQTHGCVLLVNILIKTNEVKKITFKNKDPLFAVIKSRVLIDFQSSQIMLADLIRTICWVWLAVSMPAKIIATKTSLKI